MSKNPKHHTPQKGCYIFQERFWMRALFEKVSLARVFFAIVVRRRPLRASSIYESSVLSYYRKRRRDDGSICDIIVNERRDMMTTTSKDAFESIRILFTRERSNWNKSLSYPLSRPRARRLTERPPGRKCHFRSPSRRSRRPHTPRRPRPPARSSFATTL